MSNEPGCGFPERVYETLLARGDRCCTEPVSFCSKLWRPLAVLAVPQMLFSNDGATAAGVAPSDIQIERTEASFSAIAGYRNALSVPRD